MTKWILAIAGLLLINGLFWGCKSRADAIQDAENKVFAIHDEVMPKTGTIMKLKKELNQRVAAIDSMQATGSAAATLRSGEEKDQAARLVQDLTQADSLMMNWMSQYNNDTLTKLPLDQAMRYLDEQKEQINDVKTKVNTSIEQARQFLGKK